MLAFAISLGLSFIKPHDLRRWLFGLTLVSYLLVASEVDSGWRKDLAWQQVWFHLFAFVASDFIHHWRERRGTSS